MKTSTTNIQAIQLTFEPKDFLPDSPLNFEKFKELIKTTYVYRVNIPVECYVEYYDSDFYVVLKDNTDKKTKTKFYITIDKRHSSKPEKVDMYFDTPSSY